MPHLLVAIIVGLAVCQVGLFLTTIFLHRTLAHRSITMAPWLRTLCRVLVWIATGIRPRQWVAVHRKHHAYTDIEGDPHSPILEGFLTVQLGNAYLYRRVARKREVVARYARDLPADAWDRWLFDHALLGLGIGTGALIAALGWRLGLIAAGVHAVSYLLLNAAINAIGHQFGKRPYQNPATNNQWLAWIVAGEGLHNNHHAAPTSARMSFERGQFDPAWWVIRCMERLGCVTVRHSTIKFRKVREKEVVA